MVLKMNNGAGPIFVKGRLIPVGGFYESVIEVPAVEEQSEGGGKDDAPPPPSVGSLPAYGEITVQQMRGQLEEWKVDFAEHDKDKATLYAFFIEEAKKHVDNAGTGGDGTGENTGQ